MEAMLFGSIAEQAGTDRIALQAASISELRQALVRRIPELATLSYAIAVDRMIVHDDKPLNGSEEIAVLPPFAGG